ncbi:MAG: hypothetical protein F4X44_10065 [Gammaproteobacteria bacterium]|nr:hypothetical protein [Gammaproteobacteria bacterium]MYD80943.1 hypothetical protein [Gammaproteobacteria bacterium]
MEYGEKKQKKIDRAVKAMLHLGSVQDAKTPEFTKSDLDRKFGMRVDRKGRGSIEEVKQD